MACEQSTDGENSAPCNTCFLFARAEQFKVDEWQWCLWRSDTYDVPAS